MLIYCVRTLPFHYLGLIFLSLIKFLIAWTTRNKNVIEIAIEIIAMIEETISYLLPNLI